MRKYRICVLAALVVLAGVSWVPGATEQKPAVEPSWPETYQFDPARQADLLDRNAVDRVARFEHVVPVDLDQIRVRAVIGVVGHVDGPVVLGMRDADLVAQVQVDRGRADLRRVEGIDAEPSALDLLLDLAAREHAHSALLPSLPPGPDPY